MTRGNLFVRYRNEDGSACELHWFGNHDFYESEVIPLIKEVKEGCPFIMLRCFDVGCVRGKVTGERWPKALSTPQPFERLAEDFKLVLKEEVPL